MEKTFTIENRAWSDIISNDPVGRTISRLYIRTGDTVLTENYNLFSKSVHQDALLSAYPLAFWLLQSWWRIFHEPLPVEAKPDIDWRMSHEIGAANQGFVWPRIAFASDFENIFIYSKPTEERDQSIRYINGSSKPAVVPMETFQTKIEDFIDNTIERLDAFTPEENELKEFRSIIKEEAEDPDMSLYRKLEAEMHFDPDEAPETLIRMAMRYVDEIGEGSLDELCSADRGVVESLDYFKSLDGITGTPSNELDRIKHRFQPSQQPWCTAVKDAMSLREEMGNMKDPIDDNMLLELLGLSAKDQARWEEIAGKTENKRVSVGIWNDNSIKFIPRKKHPQAKRFEMARFIGDYIVSSTNQWMVATDQSTARQKYQRAFSAEFLCPIDGLLEFLQYDFTVSAIEEAASHFSVSVKAVESLLANNGYIDREFDYTYF